jgi:hypothetical protein
MTKWNVLALLAIVIGGGLVIAMDQLGLSSWVNSGKSFPIAQRMSVDLPAGEHFVYYESRVGVPRDSVTLYFWGPDGQRVFLRQISDDISYQMLLSGWSGRALWRLNLPVAGSYSFKCDNHNYPSDAEIPPDDRVVFLKQPDSLDSFGSMRKTMQIAGGSVVFVIVVIFYVLHGRTLAKRKATMAAV